MSEPAEIRTVAVIGCGLMGAGIAEAVAVAGLEVIVRERDEAALTLARARIDKSLARALKRKRRSEADTDAVKARIAYSAQLPDLARAQLVIEAVPEDAELKREVLAAAAAVVSPQTLIASNTSSIPIAELARAIERPERVLGLHFFLPVTAMALVEVVAAIGTGENALTRARAFAKRIGKTPIASRDRSGFIVNALLIPYLLASIRMVQDGFASREDIDTGMRLGCGHPMGPLTLSDFIGLDVLLAIAESLHQEFARPDCLPPPMLRRMVAAGRLGRKSGRGFYDYV